MKASAEGLSLAAMAAAFATLRAQIRELGHDQEKKISAMRESIQHEHAQQEKHKKLEQLALVRAEWGADMLEENADLKEQVHNAALLHLEAVKENDALKLENTKLKGLLRPRLVPVQGTEEIARVQPPHGHPNHSKNSPPGTFWTDKDDIVTGVGNNKRKIAVGSLAREYCPTCERTEEGFKPHGRCVKQYICRCSHD